MGTISLLLCAYPYMKINKCIKSFRIVLKVLHCPAGVTRVRNIKKKVKN